MCKLAKSEGYRTAFCRNIFAFHAGQCKNWGYTENEIAQDPCKVDYGEPYTYKLMDEETFEPISEYKI